MAETISENDILDNNEKLNKNSLQKLLKEQNTLKRNDLIIHIDYGLGKFVGLENIKRDGKENDFIKIEYKNNVILLIPAENCDLITKYSGFNENVILDKIGIGNKWSEKKHKIRQHLIQLAKKLIKIAIKRKLQNGQRFIANDGEFEDFCNLFSFKPTPDQEKAVDEIKNDLSSGKIMDRLLCGDVGFGKTEVALRIAFIIVKNKPKAQIAVIVPTTLLCKQHYKNFTSRFSSVDNVNIKSLSRFTTTKESKQIREDLKSGKIDIIIGTHALLGKNIEFNNLGLIIVDEEQFFGVSQKEKLKQLKNNCHILSMSATPIPRTLQMSMSGIRDLSLITTPPLNRINVKTSISYYDDDLIKEAIELEIKRNGRIFFVVPKITDIKEVEARLTLKMPDVKFCSVHGQMLNAQIDTLMNDFYEGKYSVLISTTIIESGLDIPFANTIIIYRANNFGLAQLYQLRGRVGRTDVQAYAYLITKKTEEVSDLAKKRLEIIQNIKTLNSGFTISSEDMELRGAGNILGEEQTGHLKDIGIELYNQMLRQALKENQNEKPNILLEDEDKMDFSPEIKLNLSTSIPDEYIDNINIKMKYYRRIADITTIEEKDKIEKELLLEYGDLPGSVKNLLSISLLRIKCKELNIQKLEKKDNQIIFMFFKNRFANPEKLFELNFKEKNQFKLKQDQLIYTNPFLEKDLCGVVGEVLGKLG